MKFNQILAINTVISLVVIVNAFGLKKQFYPSVVYISNSKTSIAILVFELVLCLALYVKVLIKLFFNQISATESERLRDDIWPIFLDTCIEFALFHKTGDHLFYFRFVCLFFFKVLHFMAKLRVESMALTAQLPPRSHIRFIGLSLYLSSIDVYQISVNLHRIQKIGLSVEVLYLFEYSIQILTLIHIFCQYILEVIERMRGTDVWDEKVVYSNYLDLIFISLKTCLQSLIIALLLKMKVLPIFIVRSVANNIRKVKTSFWKAVMSRRAIARMALFPNPMPEDLSNDNMCAICRDEIQTIESAKKLFCKHFFHIPCLKDWFRRQQTCPTCRSDVINARQMPDN